MTAARIIAILALGLVLAACDRGPDEAALQSDVEARLTGTFGEGALRLAWFRRSGSAPDPGGAGGAGAIVYFDAEIEIGPGVDLAAWDSPGAGALANLLGATAEGIRIVESADGRQPSRLQLHGSLSYEFHDGGWIAHMPDPAVLGAPSPLAATDPFGAGDSLQDRVSAVLADAQRDAAGAAGDIIAFELEAALGIIERRLARAGSLYTFASGPVRGEYWRLGRAYARFAEARGVRVGNLATAGSVENVRALRRGEADVAMVQSDIAALALEGRGPFEREGPAVDLRALASLYPEAVHIVVMSGSGIESVSDLAGRSVNLGSFGSGSRHNALAVLGAYGLSLDDLGSVRQGPPGEALQALGRGEVDAVFVTIGAPARLIASFLDRQEAHLIALGAEATERLSRETPGLVPFAIPTFSYAGQPAPVPTVASTALLLATTEMPDGEVDTLLTWTFEEMDFLALGSLSGTRVAEGTAQTGIAIPLHDGAAAYFESRRASAAEPADPAQ